MCCGMPDYVGGRRYHCHMHSNLAMDATRIDAVVALAREIAALYGRMCELVAGCDYREDEWLREELALALNVSAYAADQLMTTGRELVRRLPATRAALQAGAISYEHARRIAEGLSTLPEEAVRRVEDGLVRQAADTTPRRLERLVERAVIAAAPEAAERAERAAVRQRDVILYPDRHGMATVVAHLPAPAATEVYLALDAAADRKLPGDERCRAERRADVLHGWARAALAGPEVPVRHGRPVAVRVTMSVETALGLTGEPAQLAGYGPITAGTARALAADGQWRALLTDAATGRAASLGQVCYRPGQAVRDHLLAVHETCAFPGCRRPAGACDLDHRTPYADGGPTSPDNLAPLCRRHHRIKTHGGWTVRAETGGTLCWTSPQHRTYRC